MILTYKKSLLWPWLGLIAVGGGFLCDSLQFLSMTGLFLVFLGIGGVGGWFSGLINCQETYDGLCLMPPEDAVVGDRYFLVLTESGRWEWVLADSRLITGGDEL